MTRPADRGSRPFAVAARPPSSAFLAALAETFGEAPEVLDAAALRREPPRSLLRTLRSRSGHKGLVLAEDPADEALLPVLEVLARAAGGQQLELVRGTLERRELSWRSTAAATVGLARGTLEARRAATRSRTELNWLLSAPVIRAVFGPGEDVLVVNPNLWFGVHAGGSVAHVAGVVNGLLDAGSPVTVAAVSRPPTVKAGARFLALPSPPRFGLPAERNRLLFHQSAVRVLQEELTLRPYRFVYQRLAQLGYAGIVVARERRLPLVLEYNGSEVWIARNWGRPIRDEATAVAAEDASLRHADLVVTVSDPLGDELVARGVPRERVLVHPNGVDADVFEPARLSDAGRGLRAQLGLAPDDLVVGFLGTFGSWHGVTVLADAIRTLAERDGGRAGGRPVRFVLVGDGLEMPAVRERLGQAGLAITTLTGIVPQGEAPAYLAAADILVSPHVPNEDGSPFFGSPTKLFEYMAMARPIVASDLDQIGEVLRPAVDGAGALDADPHHGELAVLVPPRDADSLLRGIRYLAERPSARAALGAAARERVLRSLTWRHHVDAITRRLDELVGT